MNDTSLTTLERLAPSLEQIDFQLTNTAIESQAIGSLAYTVSLEKISASIINNQEESSKKNPAFSIQPKKIEFDIKEEDKNASKFKKSKKSDRNPSKENQRPNLRLRNKKTTKSSTKDKYEIERPAAFSEKKNIFEYPTASTFRTYSSSLNESMRFKP